MALVVSSNLDQSVGSLAHRDFTALRADQNVEEALAQLRTRPLGEKIIYFYVIDPAGKLVGVVPTRRLLMAPLEGRIAQIMVQNVISIPESMTVLDACEFFVMHRLLAFPVVDAENRLTGVVDAGLFTEEVFDVSERQTADDIFQLIGVRIAQGRRASPWASFRNRFPWLLCNIGGGIGCAFLAGMYEQLLDSVIVLALFIPVVLALSESVSMQSMTLTLQALHAGRADWKQMLRSLRQELLTAVLLGTASGGLVGLIAWGWKRHALVAVAIGSSIDLSVITACLLGVILPVSVHAVRGDPKVAAGPIVLAAADILTLLFLLNLSGRILG